MIKISNKNWNLESFIDSLTIELDKARETLAVKAINRPLTYTVKDVGLDLQLFPSYDGEQVRFVTAEPGQAGASKLSLQLGSITDQQIRQTSKAPATKDDVTIETTEVDSETKNHLRKIGVTSLDDIEKLEKRNVDLGKVSNRQVNYKDLANILKKSKRASTPPSVGRISLQQGITNPILSIEGDNLHVDRSFKPVAVINNKLVKITNTGKNNISVEVAPDILQKGKNELIITLDPYALFRVNLKTP